MSEYGIKNIMGIVNNFIIHICIGVKGIKELNVDLNNLLEKQQEIYLEIYIYVDGLLTLIYYF